MVVHPIQIILICVNFKLDFLVENKFYLKVLHVCISQVIYNIRVRSASALQSLACGYRSAAHIVYITYISHFLFSDSAMSSLSPLHNGSGSMPVLQAILVIMIASLCHLCTESYLIRQDSFRSSTISTTPNHFLDGCSFKSQRTDDIFQCSRMCLSDYHCLSFNYKHIGGGVCQLNSKNVEGLEDSLLYLQGFTYGEMQNLSVSIILSNKSPIYYHSLFI